MVMTTYQHKLWRLAAKTSTRTEYAEEARRHASDGNLSTIDTYITNATRLARQVQERFPEDYGSPLPDQLAYALETEINAWNRLTSALPSSARLTRHRTRS
jgi:hypothetical protein